MSIKPALFEVLESRLLFDGGLGGGTAAGPTTPTGTGSSQPAASFVNASLTTGLTGEFFTGDNFQTPQVVRTDAKINFNWATGRPDQDVAPGVFTARWTGTLTPKTSGNYTIYTDSDSGTRVLINGSTVLDNFSARTASVTSGTVALTAGQQYSIQVEYVSRGKGPSKMQLLWSAPGVAKQVIPRTVLAPDSSVALPTNQALVGTYYLGSNFTNPLMTRVDPMIRFDWQTGVPDHAIPAHVPFSVRWVGQITPTVTGSYKFETISDDGVRLFINGTKIIGDFNVHSAKSDYAKITLQAGQTYSVDMDYFSDGVGHNSAKLLWAVPGSKVERFVHFTLPPVPATPTGIAATAVSSSEIDVTWADVSKETGYTIERSADGGATFTQAGTVGENVTQFDDTGLTGGTTYEYEVIATNATGDSGTSNVASATTFPAPVVTSVTVSGTTAVITWTASPTATSYLVERSLNGTTGFTTVGTTADTTLQDSGLGGTTQYFYRVTAVNSIGSSPASGVVAVTTSTPVPSYATLTTLYGLTADGHVYSIDTTTGATTQIGTLSFGTNAAGRDPISGDFAYVSTGTGPVAISVWDPTDGSNTVIASAAPVDGSVSLAAFRDDGTFFMATSVGDLYEVDRATETPILIGTLQANGSTIITDDGDIAFAPDDDMYIVTHSELYMVSNATVRAGTGSGSILTATDIGNTGGSNLQIAFGQNGVLYGSDTNGQLVTVNTTTAATTPIGTPASTAVNDLASVPLYANLSVTQTASTLIAGSSGSYSIQVANTGPDATVGPITLTDTLPAGVSFVSGSGNGWSFYVNGSTVTMTYLANVPVNGTVPPVILNVAVGSSVSSSVTNTVTASTTIYDSDISDNTSTLTTPVT